MAHRSDTLIRFHVGQVKDKPSRKNQFLWESGKSHVFSLCSVAFHCSFFSLSTVFMLDWLFLIFYSVRFLCCSFSLSRDILGTLSETESRKKKEEEDERQKKKKDKEKSRTEVNIEVSLI